MDKYFDTEVKYVKGVGDKRAVLLEKELDIKTIGDLLYNFPFRHVDRSRFWTIAEFSGEMPAVQLRGRFVRFVEEGEGLKRRRLGLFSDGYSLMETTWFLRGKRRPPEYLPGKDYVIFGKPTQFRNSWSMVHPEVEVYDPTNPPKGLRGIYSLTEAMRRRGLSTIVLQGIVRAAITHPRFSTIEDVIPSDVCKRHSLMPLREALINMHFPESVELLQKARERMKFEELYFVQLHILRYARDRKMRSAGFLFPRVGDFFNRFYSNVLPFKLTGAQQRVIKEIRGDMISGRQMNRLLQGDVGSGKTMVAFMTALLAADNGFQTTLMAPTEILARQHYENISQWGYAVGLNVRLLTGSTRTAERRDIDAGLQDGSIHLLVGTHALLEDHVQFQRLGLAIIDEQHRFGVAQRGRLWNKQSTLPHVLIMTATPIPRTLAMTVYGDLEVSIIDELPPGRKPITTRLLFEEQRGSAYRLVNEELKKGRQAYFVYPAIYEKEESKLHSLEAGVESLRGIFSQFNVSYVHGKMKPEEKQHQMDLFVNGQSQIMVATTVIEVGVNVPNASVMVIEDAERFGLSQLHQLRGRVGRGADQSFCVLMTRGNIGGDTAKRLNIMTETTDGFLLSEADLKLRGPGDLEGTQQSGVPFNLRVASLATDGQIVSLAREAAEATLDAYPQLTQAALEANEPAAVKALRNELGKRFANDYDWSKIS